MSYKKSDYDKRLEEHDDARKRILIDIVTPVIEEYATKAEIQIKHPFPQMRDIWTIVDDSKRPTHFMIDHDRQLLIFEINNGSPRMEIALWSYEELFEFNSFNRAVKFMRDLKEMGLYYS